MHSLKFIWFGNVLVSQSWIHNSFFHMSEIKRKDWKLTCQQFLLKNGYWKNEKLWINLKHNFAVFRILSRVVQQCFTGDQLKKNPKDKKDFQTAAQFVLTLGSNTPEFSTQLTQVTFRVCESVDVLQVLCFSSRQID